jgi:hypothetical protein
MPRIRRLPDGRRPWARSSFLSVAFLKTRILCAVAVSIAGSSACGSSSTPESSLDSGTDTSSRCSKPLIGIDASVATVNACFPDHDGINGGDYTFDVTVDDSGFSKTVFSCQNDARVTLTLKNTGTKPHGFEIECTSVTPAYPTVPKGCPTVACFDGALIAPLAPGASKTIVFDTPTPDNLLYPVRSSAADDCSVPGLNGAGSQWSLM